MSEDRQETLTDEEVAEKVRARKARTRWGTLFAIVGVLGFLTLGGAMAYGIVFQSKSVGMEGLTILGMFFAMAAVGAGFADPSEIRSFWK